MEKNKKLFLICLAVVFIACTATAAMAEKSLIVGNGMVSILGDDASRTTTINITLSGGFNDVNGLAFTLTYDPDVFEFVGLAESGKTIDDGGDYDPEDPPDPLVVESTLYYQANDIPAEGRVLIAAASANFFAENTSDVVPFRVQFRILPGQSVDTYTIGVEPSTIGPNVDAGYDVETEISVAVGLSPLDDPATAASYDVILVEGSIEAVECTHARGDVDKDGIITPQDAVAAFWLSFDSPWTFDQLCTADYDGDGNVTPQDAVDIFWASF